MSVRASQSTGSWRAIRVGVLAAAGVLEGLMLAQAPVIERYVALRLGPDGVAIDITLLCCAVLGLLGVAAAFATWLQVAFYAALAAAMAWGLAESSQHPFWIWSSKGIWRPQDAGLGRLAAHAITVALAVGASILHALQDDADAAHAQAMPDVARRDALRRAGTAGAFLACAAAATSFLMARTLDSAAASLVGALQGTAAFAVLLGCGLLLLAGLGLLATASRVGGDPGAPSETPPPAPRL